MNTRWKPSVTVAAVIEQEGRYLLIEEHTPEGLRLNNPAGHLEQGEDPISACAREAIEETAHPFEPQHLVGVYLSRFQRPARAGHPAEDVTYLRFAFSGRVGAPDPKRLLDEGIVRTLWMGLDELRQCPQRHRSPMLLACLEDHAAGRGFGLDLLHMHESVKLLHK